MDQSLTAEQVADLTDLLGTIATQSRFARTHRDDAAYWAEQIRSELDPDDAETIAWLLADVAGHPFLPEPLYERVHAWTASLERGAVDGVAS
ncbi:MAG TPA: hypothetical protein VFA46_05705 [Actinomycetes bacterium]|jgi:hypothetical protein|nr:hypothetical protein [Actinomycetes bacterium]